MFSLFFSYKLYYVITRSCTCSGKTRFCEIVQTTPCGTTVWHDPIESIWTIFIIFKSAWSLAAMTHTSSSSAVIMQLLQELVFHSWSKVPRYQFWAIRGSNFLDMIEFCNLGIPKLHQNKVFHHLIVKLLLFDNLFSYLLDTSLNIV